MSNHIPETAGGQPGEDLDVIVEDLSPDPTPASGEGRPPALDDAVSEHPLIVGYVEDRINEQLTGLRDCDPADLVATLDRAAYVCASWLLAVGHDGERDAVLAALGEAAPGATGDAVASAWSAALEASERDRERGGHADRFALPPDLVAVASASINATTAAEDAHAKAVARAMAEAEAEPPAEPLPARSDAEAKAAAKEARRKADALRRERAAQWRLHRHRRARDLSRALGVQNIL